MSDGSGQSHFKKGRTRQNAWTGGAATERLAGNRKKKEKEKQQKEGI